MKHICLVFALIAGFLCSCCNSEPENYYEKMANLAAEQYLTPVRQGGIDSSPFWNGYSKRFLYAPAFDFQKVEGAQKYLFTVSSEKSGKTWSFTSASPKDNLSPIWNDIEPGEVALKVEGMDASGSVLGLAGERKFFRNYPFNPPYAKCTRSYREAALMCLVGIHRLPYVQSWLTQDEPDMTYEQYTYVTKIVSGLISIECLLAREKPELRDEALTIAEKAAAFLFSLSQDENGVLPYFTPTYYKDLIVSGRPENKGKAMVMEPTGFGQALLNLYNVTKDQKYYDRAVKLAQTYVKLQREDGSLPVKVDYQTGEPVNNVCALLHPILSFWSRLEGEYNASEFSEPRLKAEKWMKENVVRTFNWNGQFEDWSVVGVAPYQNLTGCTSGTYASYLLGKKDATDEDVALAREIACFVEDQFVNWDYPVDEEMGFKTMMTPCVFEQLNDNMAIDASADLMVQLWLDIYDRTGDELMFAKAQAMCDGIVQSQFYYNGIIPTAWYYSDGIIVLWFNCTVESVLTLMRMDKELESR